MGRPTSKLILCSAKNFARCWPRNIKRAEENIGSGDPVRHRVPDALLPRLASQPGRTWLGAVCQSSVLITFRNTKIGGKAERRSLVSL